MKRKIIIISILLLGLFVSAFDLEEKLQFSYGNPTNLLIENNYLYVAAGKNLLIYDITDTLVPEFCSKIVLYDSPVFQMKMHDEHLYVMYSTKNNMADEITIIDVNDKNNPVLDFRGLGGFDPRDICFVDSFAFLTGWNLAVLNIANPSEPILVKSYSEGNTNGVAANGNYLYLGAGYLSTYDISNPANPVFVGDFVQPVKDLGDFMVNDSLLICTADGWLNAFDIRDPSNPKQIWLVPYEVTDYAFTAEETILAINNTDFMYFDITPFSTYTSYKYMSNINGVTEMALYGNKMFFDCSRNDPSVYIYDMPNPSDLITNTSFRIGFDLKKSVTAGNTLYALSNDNIIYIYFIDIESVEYDLKSFIKLDDWIQDICVVDKTLYASGSGGLNIIDVSDETSPLFFSKYDLGQLLNRIERKNDFLFVADYSSGIHIFDITDRKNPIHILKDESCNNLNIKNFVLAGNLMIVNSTYDYYDDISKITVEDVSRIDCISILSEIYVEAGVNEFITINDTLISCAIATCYNDGLWLLDLNPPDSIRIIKYDTPGWCNSICYTKPKFFASDYNFIYEYKICPKYGLTKLDSIEVADHVTDFSYADDYIFTIGYYGSGIAYSLLPSLFTGISEKPIAKKGNVNQELCSERFFTMPLPENNSKLKISFFDMAGRKIDLKYSIAKGNLLIDTEGVRSGLFFVNIYSETKNEFIKINKVK